MSLNLTRITHQQVTPQILTLFDISKPTMPRAFNVLEGLNRGDILVDDPSHPSSAVVRDGMYSTLYFGGHVNENLLAALVQQFREIGEVGIGCWLDDPINEIIPPDFDYDGRTYYFTERDRNRKTKPIKLPAGYHLLARDERVFRKSFDYQSTLDLFGTMKAVLKNTLGVAILHGDDLVCEAATGASTHKWIEVGVTTAESYRGRGFASIACARLIEICEEKGYSPWWDCAKQNIPSVRLARKIGYQNVPEYRYVWWSKKDSAGKVTETISEHGENE